MSDEIRMLTYAEAGRILGIKPESVARRARNRRWRKELGNDGLMRVGIPLAIIPPEVLPDVPPDIIQDISLDNPDNALAATQMAALETEVRMLREMLKDLREERDSWRESVLRRRWWFWAR